MNDRKSTELLNSPRWYEIGINWQARMNREIPILREVFGPPGESGILDAGCGPGRHLVAMAGEGYKMAGLDPSAEMLTRARANLQDAGVQAELIHAKFEDLTGDSRSYDGVYSVGNSLAATGSREAFIASIEGIVRCIRPGGRLFFQVLNFERVRLERPYVIGPRVGLRDGIEYVSTRSFTIYNDQAEVTSVTVWKDGDWKQQSAASLLYAVSREQVEAVLPDCGMRIDALYGDYHHNEFCAATSVDLIVVATKLV